tara:strand:+ start:1354 stop:2526 length:1173 start_codon:yes stop_codon:yes gene_type:complete
MALNTVSSDRLSTNVKNTNFTEAEKQDLTNDIKPLLGSSGGGNKNLIINGAMQLAQRGTSSTSAGYTTVDRFKVGLGGNDEGPTMSQANVASGTTPYTNGFRNCFKITNGNQTSGAGADDTIEFHTRLEGQNIATSGWNYTSTSSFITLSFWIKSSVAQSFPAYLHTQSNPEYIFPFETGSLTADTWTKITKTIPGNTNLVFDNDNAHGLKVAFVPFRGTNYTDNSVTYDAWQAYSASARTRDMTSTWYTTNDATLEVTGIQLEVGSVATDFEHRSFAMEELLCQRYFAKTYPQGSVGDRGGYFGVPSINSGTSFGIATFPVTMRSNPTVVLFDGNGGTGKATQHGNNYLDATASGITKSGFTYVSRPSGNWTSNAQNPINCGYTADAEL